MVLVFVYIHTGDPWSHHALFTTENHVCVCGFLGCSHRYRGLYFGVGGYNYMHILVRSVASYFCVLLADAYYNIVFENDHDRIKIARSHMTFYIQYSNMYAYIILCVVLYLRCVRGHDLRGQCIARLTLESKSYHSFAVGVSSTTIFVLLVCCYRSRRLGERGGFSWVCVCVLCVAVGHTC